MMAEKKQIKWKMNKKMAIGLLVVAVAIGGSVYVYGASQAQTTAAMSGAQEVQTANLEKTTLTNYIAASGTIYSGNSQNVYTTQNYPVKEIFVEVGDVVKAGDILATLDMTNLDYDISQAELNLLNARKSTTDSVQSASNSIQNAQQSIESAKLTLEKQQLSANTLKEKVAQGTSDALVNAQNTVDSTKQALDAAQIDRETKTNDYNTNKQLFDAGVISKGELDDLQLAMDNANTSYDTALENNRKALESYTRTQTTLAEDLVTAEKDLQSAVLSYENAENTLKQAQMKSANTTSTVESQQISLTKLREQRLESDIVAPIDGTITTVNATIGSTGGGTSGSGTSGSALFVVEDMNDLYVSSSVKEFRVGDVAIGQTAAVTTDATTGQTFKGELTFIAPTATSTSSTSNVEFEIKVKLLEVSPNLKIGMNAYANIILESKENVYAVASDAIKTNPNGESFIYMSANDTVVEIPVKTGLETDTLTEISSDQLKDGLSIFLNASTASPTQATGAKSDKQKPTGERPTGERPTGATPAQGAAQ